MNLFFVYGTLMTSTSNHKVIPAAAIEKVEHAVIDQLDLYATYPVTIHAW